MTQYSFVSRMLQGEVSRLGMVSVSIAMTMGLAFPVSAKTPSASHAATATADESLTGDIVVTATRQNQTAQRVPISLTAVGADQLEKEGVTSATQLGQIAPSMFVLGSVSEGSPRFTMRGLTGTDYSASGSPAIATYIDDVYQASQFGITSSLFDLQRIEILRGPQGTTFGKNTTGGAVAYFAQTPTNESEGYVSGRLGGGDRSQRAIEGAVNVPIIDGVLALRVSGRFDSKGAWIDDLANNRKRGDGDGQSGRFQLRWTPSTDTTANLTVFGTRWRGDEPVALGVFLPGPVKRTEVSLSPYNLYDNFDNTGATLRIEQALGFADLTAISHYRRTVYNTAQDIDGTAGDFFLYESNSIAKQYGQEVRLTTDSTARVSGLLGGYYEHDTVDDINAGAATIDDNFNSRGRFITKTDTYAVFGNLKVNIVDGLSVIGGLRKTWETIKVDGIKHYFFPGGAFDWTQGNILFPNTPPVGATPDLVVGPYHITQKSTPVTWDATINYNPDRSLLLFARIAKGFRSGGSNYPPAATPVPFDGETVKSYEAGVKSTLFGGMVRANASVYHYYYTNQQVTQYTNLRPYTANAASSKVDGGEVELTVTPDEHWNLRGSVSYTNARYTTYLLPGIGADFSGNRLVQAPRWNANGSIGYTTPVSDNFNLRGSTTWTYRTKVFFDASEDPNLADGPVATGAVRLGIEPSSGKGLSLAAYVDNVTNKRQLASGFAEFPGFYAVYFNPGRTFGVDISYKW